MLQTVSCDVRQMATVEQRSPLLSNISALVAISSAQDRAALASVLTEAECSVSAVGTYREAMGRLGRNVYGVIVCSPTFVDGSWEDIVGQIAPLPQAPAVVLATACPEAPAYQEALALGAISVLRLPVDSKEVLRAVSAAALARSATHA